MRLLARGVDATGVGKDATGGGGQGWGGVRDGGVWRREFLAVLAPLGVQTHRLTSADAKQTKVSANEFLGIVQVLFLDATGKELGLLTFRLPAPMKLDGRTVNQTNLNTVTIESADEQLGRVGATRPAREVKAFQAELKMNGNVSWNVQFVGEAGGAAGWSSILPVQEKSPKLVHNRAGRAEFPFIFSSP